MTDNNPDDLSALPVHPDPGGLLEAYRLCRMKLVRANRSRSALKAHDDRRRTVILDLQAQLEELETSLREEAKTKTRIHELNEKILEIVKDMESGNDEIADIVEEKGVAGITGWALRVYQLVPIMLRLQELKAKAVRLLRGEYVSFQVTSGKANEEALQAFSQTLLLEPADIINGNASSGRPPGPPRIPPDLGANGQINWETWDAQTWNLKLLKYCFFSRADEPDWTGIPATEEELLIVTGDESGDPMEMASRLVSVLIQQAATRKHPDRRVFSVGEIMNQQAANYQPTASRRPPYFAFLWLTCLIAQGYPDPQDEGEFHARYERVFGKRDNQQLRMLPKAWEKISIWLGLSLDDKDLGTGHRRLELPPVDPGRSLISHSWKLSFPRRSDRKRLLEGLRRYENEGKLDPCSLDLIEFLYSYNGFARTFATELHTHLFKLRSGEPPQDWFTGILRREIITFSEVDWNYTRTTKDVFGSLLLRSIPGEGYGLLVLEGAIEDPLLSVVDGTTFNAAGWSVLLDMQAADENWAAYDVGSRVLDRDGLILQEASRLIEDGLLIFSRDPRDGMPRLLLDVYAAEASHVLVDKKKADDFLDAFGGSDEGYIEEGWTCIRDFDAQPADLVAFRHGDAIGIDRGPALVTTQGIQHHGGWLPTQLGLPCIRVRGSAAPDRIDLIDQDENQVIYKRSRLIGEEDLWKPLQDRSPISRLLDGPARVEATFPGNDQLIRRRLTIRSLSGRAKFVRKHPLVIREDWGRQLGPLICEAKQPFTAADEAIRKAEILFGQGDRANPSLEREMLDALSARFEKRSWISRHEFYGLYRCLDPNTGRGKEYPLLMEGLLRAWCECGWLEEGLEDKRFLWRIQPVDPRLVCRPDGNARLTGLTSSSDLLNILSWSIELGENPPRAIKPANPRMPRGWEFSGDLEALSLKTGLALVQEEDWVSNVTLAPWKVEPLDCDGPEWADSPHDPRTERKQICGYRRRAHIFRNVAPEHRPNSDTMIVCEKQGFSRRRWRTEGRPSFVSSIRNRVCLAAAAEAGNGYWPFGYVQDRMTQRLFNIERLFDCDAYLPLPIGRVAALYGNEMPGPKLIDPPRHTHRYVFDLTTIETFQGHNLLPTAAWSE